MTEPTPAALRHAEGRVTTLCQWMQEHADAFACDRGEMVVEWTRERLRVTVELDPAKGNKERGE